VLLFVADGDRKVSLVCLFVCLCTLAGSLALRVDTGNDSKKCTMTQEPL
jgi:hypothetical protein